MLAPPIRLPSSWTNRKNLAIEAKQISMSALRSKSWRLTLLPITLLAALLLPTLHLHSAYGHDDDGHLHQHVILHTDFLSTSAQEYGNLDGEGVAVHGRHFADFSQNNLSALTAHADQSRTVKLTEAPRYLAVALEESFLRLVLIAFVFEQEHQPPPLDVYRTPNAPRSPPVLA